jgi:hypothetical protein
MNNSEAKAQLLLLGFKLNQLSVFWGLLTGLVMPQKLLEQFIPGPAGELIGSVLSAAQIVFVWYVRSKLFPDLGFFGARKVNSRYVFSS